MSFLSTVGGASLKSFGSGGLSLGGSASFNGTAGAKLSTPNTANFTFGTGDFTVEAWLYPTAWSTGNSDALWYGQNTSSDAWITLTTYYGSGQICFYSSRYKLKAYSATAAALNTWSHVAVVRRSGTLVIYVNGVSGGYTWNFSGYNFNGGGGSPTVGNYSFNNGINGAWQGKISNFRISKSAVYAADFTPATRPLTPTSQGASSTQLLLTFSNSGSLTTDSSANALTMTNGGSVIYSPISPFSQSYVTPPAVTIPFAAITPSTTTVNEGSSVTFTIAGTNTPNGTYYWSVDDGGAGLVTTSDFTGGVLNGSFTITSGAGSVTLTATADLLTEGDETFTFYVRTGSVTGTNIGQSADITIADTSLTPSVTSASSVNEGSSIIFTASNLGPDGTYYWTILNISTSTADFYTSSGSFTISGHTGSIDNGTGTFTINTVADSLTEGAETFQVQVRSGSTSGTVLATSSTVTVNDTSLTPQTTLVTTAGTGSITTPTGYNYVTVEAVGAGGNGFGTSLAGANAGGGGGAYAQSPTISVTSGSTVVYYAVGQPQVGYGGAGTGDSWVNVGSNTAPGATTVGCLAKGGTAGLGSGTGGTGGATSTSIGVTKYAGGNGSGGPFLATGGGGAGDSGNGNNAVTTTAGTGGTGTNITGGNGGAFGSAGSAPGGGGGSGPTLGTNPAGGVGRVRITFYS
jgi:hypothetical protein